MQTVLDILKKTTTFFEDKGIDNARLNAELLLADGLGCKRLDLYLRFDEYVHEAKLPALRERVKRRGLHEPLQYIIGDTDFIGLQLKVDQRALIPRPETEELAERLVQYWGEDLPKTLLDLGTGSGALMLALLNQCPELEAIAVDKSIEALMLANENAKQCGLGPRVKFLNSNWFESVEGRFDWITSNPPYLTDEEWASAKPEVKEYEPKSALVAANEGLADLIKILEGALNHLNKKGGIALETGILHHTKLTMTAHELGYSEAISWQDLSGRDRFFVALL